MPIVNCINKEVEVEIEAKILAIKLLNRKETRIKLLLCTRVFFLKLTTILSKTINK